MTAPARPAARSTAGSKTDYWLNHCVHRIATGRWGEGERLPSVRDAKQAWGVDAQTVLRVYAALEKRGLVDRRPRSGVFVRPGGELGRLRRHRHALAEVFEHCRATVLAETDLSPLAVFRYFAQLAEIRATAAPECAFLECTATQAAGHAEEVRARLGLPCLPLTVDELDAHRDRLPKEVRTLLVSAFHWHQIKPLESHDDLRLVRVPIELDPAASELDETSGGVLLELESSEGESLLDDLAARGCARDRWQLVVSTDPQRELERIDRDGPERVLLSPRVWGRIGDRWRGRAWVTQLTYRIAEDAWPNLADQVGLPLGLPG